MIHLGIEWLQFHLRVQLKYDVEALPVLFCNMDNSTVYRTLLIHRYQKYSLTVIEVFWLWVSGDTCVCLWEGVSSTVCW